MEDMEYKVNLILSGIRNLLKQNNFNGVNDYLIELIEKVQGGK